MNKKLQIAFGVSIALASFAILHFTFPLGFEIINQEPMYMDPRLMEATKDGFAISTSNVNLTGIYLSEEQPEIILQLDNAGVGFISMDNPIPIFKKLYSQYRYDGVFVLADGEEIEHILTDETLQFDVNYNKKIIIIGTFDV